ncbi:hypothetical protein AB4151_06500 [Vibrio splendidus]|jgi:hypothetical protein|uniref:DUF4145 domain-containing protein n=1 Tax=Vibrio splendidus TaxID=29497 RepID=A0A2N7C8N7_VIBSP|nr:hypothetical protein [Vibrio splendidus]PMF17422.1 hypothetical protein BCV19_01985 [Vibrio splendidus]
MKSVNVSSILLQESDLGKVIHTQIQIEHLINDYLASALEYPEHLKPIGLDYSGKVQLALALGLSSELKKPLGVLGKIRNDFAHNLDTKIDTSYMNNFYDSFPAERKEEFMKVARETNQSWIVESVPWKKVKPEQKFQLLCITLYYWCKFHVESLQQEQKMNKLGRLALKQLDASSK